MLDVTTHPGWLGLGKEDKKRWVELEAFYKTPGVPAPAGGTLPPVDDPGPKVCPAVWCSRHPEFPWIMCNCVGKKGHGKGGTVAWWLLPPLMLGVAR